MFIKKFLVDENLKIRVTAERKYLYRSDITEFYLSFKKGLKFFKEENYNPKGELISEIYYKVSILEKEKIISKDHFNKNFVKVDKYISKTRYIFSENKMKECSFYLDFFHDLSIINIACYKKCQIDNLIFKYHKYFISDITANQKYNDINLHKSIQQKNKTKKKMLLN